MKNLKKLVFGLLAMLVMVTSVNAEGSIDCSEDYVAMVEGKCYATLEDAVESVKSTEKTVIDVVDQADLLNSITIDGDKNIELNLKNDVTISSDNYLFYVNGNASLKITGNGTITNTNNKYTASAKDETIYVGGSAKLEIGKNVIVKGFNAITFYNATGATLDLYGTLVSGRDNDPDPSLLTDPSIEGLPMLGGGVNVGSGNSGIIINIHDYAAIEGEGVGLFLQANNTTTVGAARIFGAAGITIKSGKITLTNSDVAGTYEYTDPSSWDGGIKVTGAAIQVESNKSYPGNIEIVINGGNYSSSNDYAFQEYVAEGTTETAIKKLEIKGGTFRSNPIVGDKGIDVSEQFATAFASKPFIKSGVIFTVKGKPATDVLKYAAEGLEISEGGMIGNIHNITFEESENYDIVVHKNAAAGELVIVSATAKDGYYLNGVLYNGIVASRDDDGSFSFTMPDEDVEITLDIIAKTPENKPEGDGEPTTEPVVEETKGDKDVTLSENTNDVLKESLTKTEDKELQEFLANNEDVTVHLEANKVDKENVAAEVVAKFESVVKGATVAEFFDLDILVTAEGVDEVHYLKELSKPITLTVDLPTKLPEVAKGYIRTYYILREHNGVYEKLDATLTKDGKLSFATDKFSKYAIAYEDVKNPDTLDSIVSIVTLAISSLGTAGYSIKKFIRK